MIKHWIVTGDTHGGISTISRVGNIARNMPECLPEESGIIILGDAGLNFYLNKTDKKHKKLLNSQGYHIYCVRGNHEERPENLGYQAIFDENVAGYVWADPDFDHIHYLMDGGEYNIGGYSVLTIGGAYSVDKYWRLARSGYSAEEANVADPKKCGWFKDECLTNEEMENISKNHKGKTFDFILSHTCPFSWQPTDLFLGCIDQSTVDNSMELWMDNFKDCVNWNTWLFGHFHADRIERPHVEQFYQEYEELKSIANRWEEYDTTGELDWWIPKSPNFYMGE